MWRSESDQDLKNLIGRLISAELEKLSEAAAQNKAKSTLESPQRGGRGKKSYRQALRISLTYMSGSPISDKIRQHFLVQFAEHDHWNPPSWVYEPLNLPPLLAITVEEVVREICAMKSSNSCNRIDVVAAEMVKPRPCRSAEGAVPIDKPEASTDGRNVWGAVV